MAGLAAYVWLRRTAPGAYALFAALVAIAHICTTAALEERCTTVAGHVFWLHVQFPAYACVTALWFLLARTYVDRPLSRRQMVWLFAIPAATTLMHWTDAWTHLYWARRRVSTTLRHPA